LAGGLNQRLGDPSKDSQGQHTRHK
jgi:hypothetical protein